MVFNYKVLILSYSALTESSEYTEKNKKRDKEI